LISEKLCLIGIASSGHLHKYTAAITRHNAWTDGIFLQIMTANSTQTSPLFPL
jgi:hypothetical protein